MIKRPIFCKLSKNRHVFCKVCEPSSYIHPRFFQDFVTTSCNNFENPLACLKMITVPPYAKQIEMIDKYDMIRSHMNINDIDKYIVKLIWTENESLLNAIIIAVQEYNESLETVRDLLNLV